MDKKRKKRFFDDDFFFPLEQIGEEMERIFREMIHHDEDFFKQIREAKGSRIYGVSIRIGPDGKPIIREFGHIKPEKKKISEEREPLVDVVREGNEVVVVAELPGVEKKDIKITGKDDSLEIKVETAQRKYYKKLKLPAKVNHKKAKTTYKNGILEIRLPMR